MAYIGIDVGTSGCKASIIDKSGTISKTAHREYPMLDGPAGHAALNLDALWKSVQEILREIAPYAGDVKAVTTASLGETLAMLDEYDNILFEGITYVDARNGVMWDRIKDDVGFDHAYHISGSSLPQIASINQYLWWKENEPAKFERVKRMLLPDSFVAYMLSGEMGMDASQVSNTLFYDVHKRGWDEAVVKKFDIDVSVFGKVYPTGTKLGKIKPALAAELGLPGGIDVLVGCHDQVSVTIGAGAVNVGDAVIGEGSTEPVNMLVSQESIEKHVQKNMLPYDPSVEEGQFVVMASQLTHGTCIRWFVNNFEKELKEQCKQTGEDVYEAVNARCAQDAGDVFFLPYMSKSYFSNGKDCALGAFMGLELGVDTRQMYRALLESLSFETKRNFKILEDSRLQINKVIATGGASQSELYMQIKADILDRPVNILKNAQSGICGMGMIGAVAEGDFDSYQEAASVFAKIHKTFRPQRDYDAKYRRYLQLSEGVKKLYREMKNG